MSILRVFLFGSVRLRHEVESFDVKLTSGVQSLLAYLLLQRNRVHSRETLAGIFWGDYEKERARSCLNTALWRLRGALEPKGIPQGTYLITTPAGEIGFNPESDYWLDIAAFEAKAVLSLTKPPQALGGAEAGELENVLKLYTCDLLEGFYSDWALRERERLRSLYLNSVASLMYYYKHQGAYEASLNCGLEILRHDPLREQIHREVMGLYLESGQRALAARQYDMCCQILAKELGIPPMEETRALYFQIKLETGLGLTSSSVEGELAGLQQALQQLRLVMQGVDEMRGKVQQTIQFIERFVEH